MVAFLVVGGIGIGLLLISLVIGDHIEALHAFDSDVFSGAAVSAFLGAFGFAGAIALSATGSLGVAVLAGLAVGVALGALVGWATRALRRGGDDSTVRSADLVGRDATVVSDIPEGGYGIVSMTVAGHITRLNARARFGLTAGTPVTITSVLSPTTSVAVESRRSITQE